MTIAATLSQVHDQKTHRIDAKRVAALYEITLSALARLLGESRETLKSRPASPKLQPKLKVLVAAYDSLCSVFPAESVPDWLRHPARSLSGLTPLELLEQRGLQSFEALIDEVMVGGYV